jgi:hypothetical protein
MQAIIVDRITVVKPKLTAIIRDKGEPVSTAHTDSQDSRPPDSEMIGTGEASPWSASGTIIHSFHFANSVWAADAEIWATSTLSKVESLLPEALASVWSWTNPFSSHCRLWHYNHPIPSVRTLILEYHACSTTTLEHFHFHESSPSAKMSGGLTIPHAMQAIIVDRITVVNPKLAAIIRYKGESVMAFAANC